MLNYYEMNLNNYLLQSEVVKEGYLSLEEIQSETINEWYTIIEDNEIPEDFKVFTKLFLIPFKISIIKFRFNSDYIEEIGEFGGMEMSSFFRNYSHVAPTLRTLYQDPFDVPFGYSKWFKCCFPDVVNWAMKGEGLSLVKATFYNRDPDKYITNGSLHLDVLIEIVIMYLKVNKKELECSMITK